MSSRLPPTRRACLAALAAGACAIVVRARGAPRELRVTWRVRADGGVTLAVRGPGPLTCVLHGPPCSRGELWSSVQRADAAAFDLGVLDAGRYFLRVAAGPHVREAAFHCVHPGSSSGAREVPLSLA